MVNKRHYLCIESCPENERPPLFGESRLSSSDFPNLARLSGATWSVDCESSPLSLSFCLAFLNVVSWIECRWAGLALDAPAPGRWSWWECADSLSENKFWRGSWMSSQVLRYIRHAITFISMTLGTVRVAWYVAGTCVTSGTTTVEILMTTVVLEYETISVNSL